MSAPSIGAADSLLDAAGWTRGVDGRRTRGGKPLTFTLLTVGTGDNAVEQLPFTITLDLTSTKNLENVADTLIAHGRKRWCVRVRKA